MTPLVKKLLLTLHILAAVGWFGAVAVFIALAGAALAQSEGPMLQAALHGLPLTTWYVILPCCGTTWLTGLVQGLQGGRLWRQGWLLAKLLLTVIITVLLLLHVEPISRLAGAEPGTEVHAQVAELRWKAAAALLALILLTLLSVLKPWGTIPPWPWYRGQPRRTLLITLVLLSLLTIVLWLHRSGGIMHHP
jgi:uncharacterized membrane protein